MQDLTLKVDGVDTRYLIAGAGPALFLLHGIGFSADCFQENIGPLSQTHTVVAVDMLGHGFTQAVDYLGEAPQVAMARHVLALAKALGLSRYSLLGSSFGAHVAAHVALLSPATVDKLVLVGSGSVFHSNEEQKKTLQGSFANGSAAMKNPTLEACAQRACRIVLDPLCIPHAMLEKQVEAYQLPDRLSAYEASIMGAIATMDDPQSRVLGRLEAITCPVLVIVGREDIRADWEVHVSESKRFPDAQVKIYQQCGHCPFLEHPLVFNKDVVEFLG
ncbi:MAG: alpha/beta fold hydrolase [Gammaproteobacteria bacterium]